MDRLIIQGVRCFHDRTEAPFAPVTLLVGENSTGKTTFLALTRIAADLQRGPAEIDLNEEPFPMGSYDQVASRRVSRAPRASEFVVGLSLLAPDGLRRMHPQDAPRMISLYGAFQAAKAQPRLARWALVWAPFQIEVRRDISSDASHMTWEAPSGRVTLRREKVFGLGVEDADLRTMVHLTRGAGFSMDGEEPSDSDIEVLDGIAMYVCVPRAPRPYAFAPIRTRPKRTYDPIKDTPEPEGSHVPMVLAQMTATAPDQWVTLREALERFGRTSGLFRDVQVRHLGREESGPFQIRVRPNGSAFNLADVGYGVSQVLPIVIDSLRGPAESTFLLQQPEVHLHPRAQAELGSFFALLSRQQKKRFIIETHSDYLVDRIRMEVREGKLLRPEDVSLLYFEQVKGATQIHAMTLDRQGNIVNAPPGYRQFFLEEERLLLGW